MVSRDVAGLLDAELLELELELPPVELLPEEETVAEPPAPVDTAVQTPKPVVPVTYALVEGYRDAQTGLDLTDASKLDNAAFWLLRAGSLALAHEAAAEE